MDWIEITLVAVFGLLLVAEVVALVRGDRPITGAARTDARMWLIWPWGLGMLSAHFWSPWRSPELAWLVTVGLGVCVIAHDAWAREHGRRHPKWAPFAALAVGVVAGLLWSRGY